MDRDKVQWDLAIEALASFNQISLSLLQDLIEASAINPDDFCENTKELVALKCLEEIYSSSPSTTLDSTLPLDFSRTCQDVLQEILSEVPLSNLFIARDRGELLKWDVNSFIVQKRAENVKSHLPQLKESILKSNLPLTDRLEEKSGLFETNRAHTVFVNDGKCNDHSVKDDGKSTCVEDLRAKENSMALILEDGNKSSKECLPDNNHLSSKRTRACSTNEPLMSYLNEEQVCINECDDSLRSTKRVKLYELKKFISKKEKQVSQLGKEMSENSTEKMLPVSENEEPHTEKNNREIPSDGSLEDSHKRCSASNLCQSSSQNEDFHDEPDLLLGKEMSEKSTEKMLLVSENEGHPTEKNNREILSDGSLEDSHKRCSASNLCQSSGQNENFHDEPDMQLEDSNGLQQTVSSDKAQVDAGNGCETEISGDTVAYQGEKIDFVINKKKSLDSKCEEGGQLLVSEVTTVPPLLVPESCIGTRSNIYPQHTSVVESCHEKSMDETNDTVHFEVIPTNDGNANKIQHMTNQSQPQQKEPSDASFNASRKPVASDKVVIDIVDDCDAELSSDSDVYHNEKVDVLAKKDELLNSQHTFGQDLPELTEQNLCMKCNEAGQLLVCKTTTCSLRVHENCLGASVQLDAMGNFFCPFCAYSCTISEYMQAKKLVSLAREQLAIFISQCVSKGVEGVRESSRQEHIFSRKSSKCKRFPSTSTVNEVNKDHARKHSNEVNNFHFERNKKQAHISSSLRESENVNNCLSGDVGEEAESEMLNAESLTGKRVKDGEMAVGHVDGHVNDKFSCRIMNTKCSNERNAGEVQQNMTKHYKDKPAEPICAHNAAEEKISEEKCKKHNIARYTMRPRINMHEKQYKTPPIRQIRRTTIPWTAEEETLIREGVLKFGLSSPKMPWKEIFDFGCHEFDKYNRTPQDLKDKWKNMCKGRSKWEENAALS